MLAISDAAEKIGFRTQGLRLTPYKLTEINLPAILHWNQEHFVVLYKIKKNRNGAIYYISDPAHGLVKYPKEEFLKSWASTKNSS